MSRKAIGHHFFIIDNKFILHFDSEVYRKFYSIIDFDTFEIIKSNGSTFHYFKDKNQVYLDSYMNTFTVLLDANPTDFKILDFENGKATSNRNAYLYDEKLPHDFSDYIELSDYNQSFRNEVYFAYNKLIPDVDIQTFEVLHPEEVKIVAKDKKHVYFRNKIVPEADAESFKFLEACFTDEYYQEQDHTFYAKDKNQAYYVNTISKDFKVIKTKNIEQFHFKVIDNLGYAYDETYQYLFGKRKKI